MNFIQKIFRLVCPLSLALAAALPGAGHAAQTDIATEPLFSTVKTKVKPNVMFVLDDSGSMAWDYMPDDARFGTSDTNSRYGRRAMQCNGLGYNPDDVKAPYALPVDATGTAITPPATNAAFLSGTATSSESPNYLASGSVSYTKNIVSISSPSSVSVTGSGSVTLTLGGSYANYYNGMVVSLFGGTSRSYSSSAYMIGKVTAWTPGSRTLTVAIAMSVGSGTLGGSYFYLGVGSPIDNVYYTYSGNQKTPLDYNYSGGSLDKESTFYKECNSAIGDDPGKSVFTANIVIPGTDEAKRYANWYYYYSTRILMMKTTMTLAFKSLGDDFRIGFDTINGNTGDLLDVADFNATQKTTFYSRVNGAYPDNSTPLRAALSKIGSYYAKKLSGQTYDPVQYSCQKNFTILSTDGYWNGSAGYQLDGTAIGQQDGGATPRPMYDGGTMTTTVKEQWDVTSTYTHTTVTPYTRNDISAATKTSTPVQGQTYKTYALGAIGSSVNNKSISVGSCTSSGSGASRTYSCRVNVTTQSNHGFVNGNTVTVAGVSSPAVFNGTFSITYVGSKDYYYTLTGTGASNPSAPSNSNSGTSYYSSNGCPAGQGVLTTTTYTRDKLSEIIKGTKTTYSWTSTLVQDVTSVKTYTRTIVNVDGAQQSDDTVAGTARVSATAGTTTTTSPTAGAPDPTYTSPATTAYTNWVSSSATSCASSKPADGSASSPTSIAATTSETSGPVSNSTGSNVAGAKVETDGPATDVAGAKTTTTTGTGTGGATNTLADVAMYYYQTDLRDATLGNCTGALGNSVCANDIKGSEADTANWQHMTTFTLGLGMNGMLKYDANYESQVTGDFASIKGGGGKNWPVPSSDSVANIDDLWHAAVNGRGHYFSASDPASLAASLAAALNTIDGLVGASSAAATSTLQPVEGDNGVYIAQFKSSEWTGDLKAYKMNVKTGAVTTSTLDTGGNKADTADWSAQAKLTTSTARKIYYLSSAGDATNGLKEFSYANLTADGLNGKFDNACSKSPALTQCAGASETVRTSLNSGAKMVDFLRGQPQTQYRVLKHILGDIVNSSPVYVGKPGFAYADAGYAKYKADQSALVEAGTRAKMLYVGANDGMLHAFNAADGTETWAYVPRLVMDKLYRLGDQYYDSKHIYTVDATPVVGDVFDGTKWRTILVGGLNAGGSGYYALDISDPAHPQSLWEASPANMGLSFGNPVITKRKGGSWVVAFTSGYNNADGVGRLFVVNAITGAVVEEISTATGSAGSPSNLGRLNAWVDVDSDNTASRFYAGDLQGNIWRFDIDDNLEPKKAAFKLAQLVKNGVVQPISTRLELAEIEANGGKHVVVYAGTGRYLGKTDVSNTEVQSIYAIKDALGTTSLADVRAGGTLVQQTLKTVGNLRTIDPPEPVDWSVKNGWYVDLSSIRERVNVDMQLAFNTLTAAGNVPADTATDCDDAGRGTAWIYQLNVVTGMTKTSVLINSMVAGLSTVQLSDGTGVTIVTKTDATAPQPVTVPPSAQGAGKARRSSWRELVD